MGAGVWSGPDLLFAAALAFGVGWALIAFLGGEFGGHGIEGHDVGIDAHHGFDIHAGDHHDLPGHLHVDDGGVRISPLSPLVIATALGGFGGLGLLASLVFRLGTLFSTAAALAGGLLFGLGIYLFYGRLLVGMQGSSEIHLEALYGLTGTVITPIPANSVGEIAVVARGARMTTMARSATGQPIPRGQLVIIQEMSGPIAIVRETR